MVCSSVSPHAAGGISRAAEDLAALGELAAGQGLRVAYEALAWGRHVNDYRDSWEIVRRADHDAVGLCLDTFHIFSRNTILDAIESIPGDRIFLAQVADAPRLSLDTLSWSRHYRCFPGQGELPLAEFMNKLAATGYAGPLSLEIFNDQFRSGDVEQTAADGYRSLVYLTDRTEHKRPQTLAPIQHPRAISFVEFAIEPSARDGFSALLGALGFVRSGLHRHKAVEHWRQSGINLVLNHEDNSYAQDYYARHGSSVCAIALKVDDVEPVVTRARQLHYPAFYGDPKNDTHGNPAIAGLSEGLLYFVGRASPSIWERDFNVGESAAAEMAYLQRIDHFSITMPYEEMLRMLLLYRSMFGMRADSTVDVFDPGGLVRNQVMRTDDDAVCFALNSSDAERTLSRQLLAQQAGTGVQHVAFATNDITAVAKRLRDAGIEVLKLPRNYYDDLQARFGLDDDRIALLTELGILYDEDDAGCYRQLYTRLIDGRFCFEVVQRDGYRGFGAANAPIRSA
jgi:4-hydroxyphenylpyruvate dioxygenase